MQPPTLTPALLHASLLRLAKLAALPALSLLDTPAPRRAPPGVEYVLSAMAADAHAAGRSSAAWRADSAWASHRPCDPSLPHADLPDRLEQAIANLRDTGLWPWP